MIDLVPNWHPVWVHFTIGLLGGAVLFYLLAVIGKSAAWGRGALSAARWSLGAGIIFAVLALLTGWWAMGSVAHDDSGHANMLVHRNWAFGTAAVFVVCGIWMFLRRDQQVASIGLLLLALVALAGLARTGFEGGQNVFEHGLGVQRLPDVGAHDHGAHEHGAGMGESQSAEGRGHGESDSAAHEHDDSGEAAHDHAEGGQTATPAGQAEHDPKD